MINEIFHTAFYFRYLFRSFERGFSNFVGMSVDTVGAVYVFGIFPGEPHL